MSEGKISVVRKTIDGKNYFLDKRTNILYNESKEPIGVLVDGKIELYDDDDDEDEVEIVTTLRIGGENVEFYEPEDRTTIEDLPSKHYISFKNYEFKGGSPIKLVVTKNNKNKYVPAGILAEENGDMEEGDSFYYIDKDDDVTRFLQIVGRKNYPKLVELGFAYPLEEEERQDTCPTELNEERFIEEAKEEAKEEEKEESKYLINLEQKIREYTEILKSLQQEYKTNPTDENKEKYKKGYILVEKLKKKYVYEYNKKEGTGIDAKVNNPDLYEKAKEIVYKQYPKHSAYRSGQLVKKYKEMGGTYSGKKETDGLTRWFKEDWTDVGNKEYPVYRPTKRITKDTPLTPDEIKPSNLKKQIALKQEIKGDANLPPFLPLEKVEPNERMKRVEVSGGKVVAIGIQAEKIPKTDDIWKWSNPEKVSEMAKKYLGDMAVVFRSTKPKKKYMIFDPNNSKWIFFGEMGYEDFTKHQDPKRRENYLTRTASMKGNWKDNKYSANNLSRKILW